jgi:AraC-like DNA-binding protein
MAGIIESLRDETVLGPRNRLRGVRAPHAELRPWIAYFPASQALAQHQIIHVGIHQAAAPMRIVRTNQTTTYFLACLGGRGRVLIDGRWRVCQKGFACLLPGHTLNAFEALAENHWEFCWVCYQLDPDQKPMSGITAPVMTRFDALPLHSAILGLIQECGGAEQPALAQAWADLIHAYVLRFVQPAHVPDQLSALWTRFTSNLADHWTLARLSREAGYSREHLRRLCRRQLGRSPMHQVTYLRMRRAAQLLASTEKTIEAIAREIGYHNPFVFSNAFTKWTGIRPSDYRRKTSASK